MMHFSYKLDTPVIVFNELHQLILSVGFSRDNNWILHEGFIEVHLIKLEVQSLGNLLPTLLKKN